VLPAWVRKTLLLSGIREYGIREYGIKEYGTESFQE